MKFMLLALGTVAMAAGQSESKAIMINLDNANWTHGKGDPAGSESVLVGQDKASGGMELLVRFPSGHVIPPHWHDSNERIIVLEGQLTLGQSTGDAILNSGGFAFLPAKEIQRLSCTSKSRCTFYLFWDGKFQSHAAK
jgi:quercetin dioxygenase-like cupin family protein